MTPVTLTKLLTPQLYFEGPWVFLVELMGRFKSFPVSKGPLFDHVYPVPAEGAPGTYILFNRRTLAFYVGSASNIYSRINKHRQLLQRNAHPNRRLLQDWGVSQRGWYDVVLFSATNRTEGLMLEQWLVTELEGRSGICNLYRDVSSSRYRDRKGTRRLYHVAERAQRHYQELSQPGQALGREGGFHDPI